MSQQGSPTKISSSSPPHKLEGEIDNEEGNQLRMGHTSKMLNKFSPLKQRGEYSSAVPENIAKYSIFDNVDMPSPLPTSQH